MRRLDAKAARARLKLARRVLCIRLGALGDLVFALHALRLLREERPDLEIGWVVEDRFAGLLEDHPDIDRLYVAPRRAWQRKLGRPLEWWGLGREVRGFRGELRRERWDASLDLHGNLRSGLVTWGAGAGVRVGLARGVAKEQNWRFQDVWTGPEGEDWHRVERDLSVLGALGIAPRYARPVIPVTEAHRAAVGAVGDGRRPLVVIHGGASGFGAIKRWLPDRWGEVARRLAGEGCEVVLSWGPGEEAVAAEIAVHSGGAARVGPATGSVLELGALLERAALVVACDTGPLHLAAALERPVVGLYGPKDPRRYGPVGTRGRLVVSDADCAPCRRRRCRKLRCMEGLTAAEVFAAAEEVLGGGGERLGPELAG
jgi:lipopolysaccharide heptosyltransferase I